MKGITGDNLLQLLEHKPRHDDKSLDEIGLDRSAIRPSMMCTLLTPALKASMAQRVFGIMPPARFNSRTGTRPRTARFTSSISCPLLNSTTKMPFSPVAGSPIRFDGKGKRLIGRSNPTLLPPLRASSAAERATRLLMPYPTKKQYLR
jgi:hypothetical protein